MPVGVNALARVLEKAPPIRIDDTDPPRLCRTEKTVRLPGSRPPGHVLLPPEGAVLSGYDDDFPS